MNDSGKKQPQWFHTTQWSQVLLARDERTDRAARDALENLCRTYWFPLYGYVRRKGYQEADAEDLTQGFFGQLLEKHRLAGVASEKGRFRTFLLTCLDNYLSDERDKAAAKKRGGDRTILSLDWEDAESRYRLDPHDNKTPERYFERKWALEILKRALARVKEDYEESGKEKLFDQLKPYLTGATERGQLGKIAEDLKMDGPSARMAVSRLRKRYREKLRAEICETVAGPEDAEDEYQHIRRVLSDG